MFEEAGISSSTGKYTRKMPPSDSASFRMPAEWTAHELSVVAWPQREEAWRGTTIEAARDTHAAVVDAISQSALP